MDGQSEFVETPGMIIRQFFRDLFGSRMAAHVELQIMQLRQDFELRLQEKDRQIATLTEEKQMLNSKIITYELTIMPHASRIGQEVVAYQKPTKPKFTYVDAPAPVTRWQKVQLDHDAQMAKELEAEKKEKVEEIEQTASLVAV